MFRLQGRTKNRLAYNSDTSEAYRQGLTPFILRSVRSRCCGLVLLSTTQVKGERQLLDTLERDKKDSFILTKKQLESLFPELEENGCEVVESHGTYEIFNIHNALIARARPSEKDAFYLVVCIKGMLVIGA